MSRPVTAPIVPIRREHRGGFPRHSDRVSRPLPGNVAAELARLRLTVWQLRKRLGEFENGADDG